jgi:hypothetical protein
MFDSVPNGGHNLTTLWIEIPISKFCDIPAAKGIIDGDLLVHKRLIRGRKPNLDTEIFTTGHPTIASVNFRTRLAYLPWLLPVVGVTWFLRDETDSIMSSGQNIPETKSVTRNNRGMSPQDFSSLLLPEKSDVVYITTIITVACFGLDYDLANYCYFCRPTG